MKKIEFLLLSVFLIVFAGCDKDLEKINTNPFAITDKIMDPGLLFAGSQRIGFGGWEREATIVQFFVNPHNTGATLFFNFNYDEHIYSALGTYTGAARMFSHIIDVIDKNPDIYGGRQNLRNICRIWLAYAFMDVVDHHGSVPYTEALRAYYDGEKYFYPKYDKDSEIYEALYNELKDAISKLDGTKDWVPEDLFYGRNASIPSSNAATQVAKWKKLGNSVLLRLGMRYSRVNPTKAAQIVTEAFNGGVIMEPADDTYVQYKNLAAFSNATNNGLTSNQIYMYYAAEPFVNQLKNTNDPRGPYLIARFEDNTNPNKNVPVNTKLEEQFGVPVGVQQIDLIDPAKMAEFGYRGSFGGGLNYSKFNSAGALSVGARTYWFSSVQNLLLLAEAAHRGWISGGDAKAKEYYEKAIMADMDKIEIFFSESTFPTKLPLPVKISEDDRAAYLDHDKVAWDKNDNKLEIINTQYWIANLYDSGEAWANHRRTDYPKLERNKFNNNFYLGDGSFGDGFPRRWKYPQAEITNNYPNYLDAVEELKKNGGGDNNTTRIFWDPK